MGSIVLLDDQTINKIAAGEVIERPANVVKEMCENSIDAGATSITVEIEKGGISFIRITDNGKGIAPDDIALSFERHATSKIRRAEDLLKISTMGFRGEALASIASVSKITMTTRTADNPTGIKVKVENGEIIEQEECGAPVGTTILVSELFYNTPVRYKFLKKDFTEGGYIEDTISKIALIHPEISFKFINNKKPVFQTLGNGDMKSVVYNVYGKDIANSLLDINIEHDGIKVIGVCGKPEIARSNRSNQLFYVNGRYIKDKVLSTAVDKAYGTLLHEGRYGFCIINIELNPEQVDVNVHPAKIEVRFQDESKVFSAVHIAVKDALLSHDITVKDNNEAEHKKEGFFDKFRPVNREAVSLADKIQSEKRDDNVVSINFEKELKELKNTFSDNLKKNFETSEDESDISLSKLNLGDDRKTEISISSFDVTDEDFEKNVTPTNDYVDKSKLFDVKEGLGRIGGIPNFEKSNDSKIDSYEEEQDDVVQDDSKIELPNDETEEIKPDAVVEEKENITELNSKKNNIFKVTDEEIEKFSKEDQENIFKEILGISSKAKIPDYQIIGVGFLTYIFVQMDDEIYIFDQHAAHERVLYEKVKANYYKEGGRQSQMLLLPDIIELSKKDMRQVQEHMDLFTHAGFELEEFGENTIKITGVPEICYEMNTRDLFLDIIDGMDVTNKTTSEEVENRFLATVACKAAVKANMKLSEQEIKGLFDELLQLENPFTCPHGRPTAIRLTRDDIEKKFKRKGF